MAAPRRASVHEPVQNKQRISTLRMQRVHALIDEEVAQLKTRIRSLRTRRNQEALISSLPVEILGFILILAVQPPKHRRFEATGWHTHVQLTSVCSLWREVALQCPSFWSCIPIIQCDHLEEMLSRSKSLPLSIRIDDYDDTRSSVPPLQFSDANMTMIMRHQRIRELHLRGHTARLKGFLRRLQGLPEDFLQLESLILVGSSMMRSTPGCLRLPSHFLSAPKPLLQHLELSNCTVKWTSITDPSPCIGNLLSLTLEELEPRIPHHLLLGILSASPAIRSIKIQYALCSGVQPLDTVEGEHDVISRISLSAVTKYIMKDSFFSVLNHRTHLKLPATARLDISAFADPFDLNDLEAACVTKFLSVFGLTASLVSQQLEECYRYHAPGRSFQSMHLDFDPSTISLRLAEIISPEFDELTDDEPFDIRLEFPSSPAAKEALLHVLHTPGLRQARVASFERTRTHPPESSWNMFLRAHPGIKKFYFFGEEIHQICRALGSIEIPPVQLNVTNGPNTDEAAALEVDEAEDPDVQAHPESVPYRTSLSLPSLKMLLLEGVDFRKQRVPVIEPHRSRNFAALFNTCVDWCNYGRARLPLIVINGSSGFDDKMETLLQEVVGEKQVEWDGIDQEDDSPYERYYDSPSPL